MYEKTHHKKILYLDMDGVIVDFKSGINSISDEERERYRDDYDQCPNIFSKMKPFPGALDAVQKLLEIYDVYILSSPGWGNSSAWSDKHDWVVKYLPYMKRRLILSSQKHLNKGDYLVDDRFANGSEKFEGEMIHFGSEYYPDWDAVLEYLL